MIMTLNTIEKLVLLAILVETDYGKKPTTNGKLYSRYVELSRLVDIKPVTQRRTLDVLKNLAEMGILWVRVNSFGRHGRTTLVKLLAPPASLCPMLIEDLVVGEMAEEVCRDASPSH
jgi:cell division control protein 6